jgi:hypothetical protein
MHTTTREAQRAESVNRTSARRQLDKIFDGGDSVISSASGAALLGAAVAGLSGSVIAAVVAGGVMIYLAASRNGTH